MKPFYIIALTLSFFTISCQKKPMTELYLQHPGFDMLLFDVYTKEEPRSVTRSIMAKDEPEHLFDIREEKVGFDFMLPESVDSRKRTEDEEGPFVTLILPNINSKHNKRLDLLISPSKLDAHVHVKVLANHSEILYDSDVAIGTDDSDPFVIPLKAEQDAAANP